MGKALAAFLAFGMPVLSACSSGGGGGSVTAPAPALTQTSTQTQTQTPPTSGIAVNLQAANTMVTYQAAAATALGASNGAGNVTMSAAGQSATITLTTDASGNLSGVEIPAGNISDKVSGGSGTGRSLTDPLTLEFYYQLQDVVTSTNARDRTIGYTLSQLAAGQGLTSSAYGLWASAGNGMPSQSGALAFGSLTPATSVPTTGSATFNGFTTGMGGATNGSTAFVLKGTAQIIANFASQTVTTNLTSIGTDNISNNSTVLSLIPNLTGTSTISGNAYTGPISGGGLTGTINGNFYGSAAQETTGVWQASGGGNAWIGSFGAK